VTTPITKYLDRDHPIFILFLSTLGALQKTLVGDLLLQMFLRFEVREADVLLIDTSGPAKGIVNNDCFAMD
jgi:hypothetical protein